MEGTVEQQLEFIDTVLKNLQKLKSGEFIAPNKTHKNYTKFIEAVKTIIDENLTAGLDMELTFNEDYSRVYVTKKAAFVKNIAD